MRYFVCVLVILFLLPVLGCAALGTERTSSTPTDTELKGTYTGESFGMKGTVTFDGNKATFYNEISGKIIYEYALMRDGELIWPGKISVPEANQILLRDHAIGIERIGSFRYLPSDKCVVIDGQRYYK